MTCFNINFNNFFCYLLDHHQRSQAVTKTDFYQRLKAFRDSDQGRQESFNWLGFGPVGRHALHAGRDLKSVKRILDYLFKDDQDSIWFELPDVPRCAARRYFLIHTTVSEQAYELIFY